MSTMTAIYGGGPFYHGGQPVIDDLKASGFTTVVAWAVHVQADGTLVFNDPPPIVSNGHYVGDPGWPGRLADLLQAPTSVNRILFSIGGWGVQDFPNIQALIKSQGTGPDSILYQNFAALKEAIPSIDGIDLDDETLYDRDTTVQFCQMLASLDYTVTFCPYTYPSFWVDCLAALEQSNPGTVTGFNLQCYAGGAGNDPATWIQAIRQKMGPGFDAEGFVFPGLWSRHGTGCTQGDCPSNVQQDFAGWKSDGIQGGFIWMYDDIHKCLHSGTCGGPTTAAAYARAIVKGLS